MLDPLGECFDNLCLIVEVLRCPYFFFLFSFFFFFLFFFFSLFVMTSNVGNYNKRDLLLVSLLILHTFLGRSMLMAKMALLGSMPCPVILMSWAILSLPTLER